MLNMVGSSRKTKKLEDEKNKRRSTKRILAMNVCVCVCAAVKRQIFVHEQDALYGVCVRDEKFFGHAVFFTACHNNKIQCAWFEDLAVEAVRKAFHD